MEFHSFSQFVDFLASSAAESFQKDRMGIQQSESLSAEALKHDPFFLKVAQRVGEKFAVSSTTGAKYAIADEAAAGLKLSNGVLNRVHPLRQEFPTLFGYFTGRGIESIKQATQAEGKGVSWLLREEVRNARTRLTGATALLTFGLVSFAAVGVALLNHSFKSQKPSDKTGTISRS